MAPSPIETCALLDNVTLWGSTLRRHEVPFVYPGGHRLPFYRQTGISRTFDLDADASRLLRRRSGFLKEQGLELSGEEIVSIEKRMAKLDPDYRPGQYLSLLRLGLDLKDTSESGLTVIERRTFHLARRRLLILQASERPAPPEHALSFLALLETRDPLVLRGLADAFRIVEESSRHPLIGMPHLAGSRQMQLLLSCAHVVRTQRPDLSVVHAFLAARAVLAKRHIHVLRPSSLLDTSLDPSHPAWEDVQEWLREMPLHQGTFVLPEELSSSLFASGDRTRDCMELVNGAVKRVLDGRREAGAILEAVERAFFRRVYKQEGAKHQQAVAFERDFEECLSEQYRKAMRAPKITASPSEAILLDPTGKLNELLGRARTLDQARSGGWTPSIFKALRILLEQLEAGDLKDALLRRIHDKESHFLSGSDELLRYALDCRANLCEAVEALSLPKTKRLATWFALLWKVSASLEGREAPRRMELSRKVRRLVGPLVPLEWACAACMAPDSVATIPWDEIPKDWISERVLWVQEKLPKWRIRLPWEIGLQGIWPVNLRGGLFPTGLEDGIEHAIRSGEDIDVLRIETRARFDLLSAEMGFCAWLGAKERFQLFRAAFQAHEGKPFSDQLPEDADV
jgi:hypothetical protein